MQRGGKIIIANIVVVAASAAAISAAMVYFYRRRRPRNLLENQVVVPLLDRSESGRVARIERFSNYVARQLGIEDASECPQLGKLTYEYIKNPKECDCLIYEYFANEPNAEELYVKLVEELERCVLAYFAFHWSQVTITISQVLGVDADQKRLKDMVMTATRKQRFQKVAKDLKVTRMFSTLVEEIKAIGGVGSNGDSQCTEVMVPAKHSERSPVLLLMGGGMGAGKSTVLKDILKEPFWAGAAANAVVVEADAFKETDVIYRALSSRGHHQDMLPTSELVHQSSTDAASSLLVTALNEGRDVIMDGTLSWEPFVEQTVAMARSVHKHRYRMGVGYKVEEDGTIVENYWEKVEDGEQVNERKPYRIELVGVVCDAYLAVVRGIRRAIQTGRAVRVKPQLKSHKRFANAFPKYCHLVDNVKLFCTNAIASPPMLIAWKDGGNKKLLVEPDEIKCLKTVANLNEEAESVYDLHNTKSISIDGGSSSVFNEIVMQPSRPSLQLELKTAVLKIENQIQG